MESVFFAKVAHIVSDYEVVINKGFFHGVTLNQKVIIFRQGAEIFDPDTNESLGNLEVIIGKARVVNVQDKISTLKSDEYEITPNKTEIRKIVKNSMLSALSGDSNQEITTTTPGEKILKKLDDVRVGDLINTTL